MRRVIAVALTCLLAAAVCLGAQQQSRFLLVIVDDLHLAFRTTPQVRQLVHGLVQQFDRESDVVAITTTGTDRGTVPLTVGRDGVMGAIARIVGNGPGRPDVFGEPAQQPELRVRARLAGAAAAAAIDTMANGRAGRGIVLYVSSGYPIPTLPEPTAFINAAVRARMPIFALDPAFAGLSQNLPLVKEMQETLSLLAAETGGMAVFDAIALDAMRESLRTF